MNEDNFQRLQALLQFDGNTAYLNKVIEELNELAVTLAHLRDGKAEITDLAVEVADVEFQIEKLKHYYRLSNLEDKVLTHKFWIYNHVDKMCGRETDV